MIVLADKFLRKGLNCLTASSFSELPILWEEQLHLAS
jgi:hypothetical protein